MKHVLLCLLLTFSAVAQVTSIPSAAAGGGSEATNPTNSGTGAAVLKTGTNVVGRTLVPGSGGGVDINEATDEVELEASSSVARITTGVGAPTGANTAGRDFYLDSTNIRYYRGLGGTSWGEVARISSGSGAPAAGTCDAAAEVGGLYYRSDNTSSAGGHYGCAQTGSGTYAWVLLSGSGGLTAADASGVNTGTSTTTAVTPDALAGSVFGQVVMQALVTADFTTDTATGDGKFYFVVPAKANGMNLVSVHAQVITAGTTNTTDVQIARCATAASGNACSGTVSDMLTTKLTIDSGENSSATAATAAAINTSNDDVATNQILRVDVDAVSTTAAKGLIVTLVFQLP